MTIQSGSLARGNTGNFDPNNNTITIDISQVGTGPRSAGAGHTMAHEVSHARDDALGVTRFKARGLNYFAGEAHALYTGVLVDIWTGSQSFLWQPGTGSKELRSNVRRNVYLRCLNDYGRLGNCTATSQRVVP